MATVYGIQGLLSLPGLSKQQTVAPACIFPIINRKYIRRGADNIVTAMKSIEFGGCMYRADELYFAAM